MSSCQRVAAHGQWEHGESVVDVSRTIVGQTRVGAQGTRPQHDKIPGRSERVGDPEEGGVAASTGLHETNRFNSDVLQTCISRWTTSLLGSKYQCLSDIFSRVSQKCLKHNTANTEPTIPSWSWAPSSFPCFHDSPCQPRSCSNQGRRSAQCAINVTN